MHKTKLFRTLVFYGALLTGGAIAVTTVAVTISGCSDDGGGDMSPLPDMPVPGPDCGLPCSPRDMAHGD